MRLIDINEVKELHPVRHKHSNWVVYWNNTKQRWQEIGGTEAIEVIMWQEFEEVEPAVYYSRHYHLELNANTEFTDAWELYKPEHGFDPEVDAALGEWLESVYGLTKL